MASGSMVFEVPGARQAQGKIVEGKITEVGTYAADDGVTVGTARIAVFATEAGVPAKAAAPAKKTPSPAEAFTSGLGGIAGGAGISLIPSKFNSLSTSGLTWKIEPGENEITLKLQ